MPEATAASSGTEVRGEIWAGISGIMSVGETRFKKKEDADAIEAATKSKAPGTVAGTKNETKSVPAPTLYSLTELQKAANRMLKFKKETPSWGSGR